MKIKYNYLFITILLFVSCLGFPLMLAIVVIRTSESNFYEKAAAIAGTCPDQSSLILEALKQPSAQSIPTGKDILRQYGYTGRLLTSSDYQSVLLICLAASLLFGLLILLLFLYQHRKTSQRANDLADYLCQINSGIYPSRPWSGEDNYSVLEDALYKTVMELRESRERAIYEKTNLAENLANISHQLKTPLTSLSLMGELLQQRLPEGPNQTTISRIIAQIDRLSSLTASLLTLSKLDAGVIPLPLEATPVEELIASAAAPLLSLLEAKQQKLQCNPYSQPLLLSCNLGWTAEAIGNLIKNCSEHAPNHSSIVITITSNPIYISLILEDSGNGFDSKDLPHLFDRFYKGSNANPGSIGIGLSMAKTIIERQNGHIYAANRSEGGARYVIQFYLH